MGKQSPPSPPAHSSGRAGGSRGATGKAPLSTELPSSEPFMAAHSEAYLLKRARGHSNTKDRETETQRKCGRNRVKAANRRKHQKNQSIPREIRRGVSFGKQGLGLGKRTSQKLKQQK